MARARRIIRARVRVDVAFAFVSDLRNAPRWDPQARAARMLGEGPIGLGARFVLVASLAGRRLELPYEIVAYDPPHRVVLEGATRWFRYRDTITFEGEGDGTRLVYDAELELRSGLRRVDPLLSLVFSRIADAATRGMPQAIERHAATIAGSPSPE